MYGSLQNLMAGTSATYVPKVGDGATEICWTDRHAATIVEVVSPRHVVVQRDISTRTDKNGMSDDQQYSYQPDPDAPRVHVTLRQNGRWVVQGQTQKGGTKYALGARRSYHDYSF
jgi:hypothetical protein